ncbi:MAG: DUF3313 domain-containing protein [Pseudomonadota bacterium]|nr:DUF3313 domain-containing protein [Pseudomonadota bacterium]
MRKLAMASILVLATVLCAPVSVWAAKCGDYQTKGFLSDDSKLKPEGGKSEACVYKNPKADPAKYDKVMIDRIKIFLREDAESKEIDPAAMKELTDYFHTAIVKAVGPAYPVVTKPGPDVVRLRIAITDLVPNAVEASVVSLVVPFLWVGDAGAGVAQGKAGSTPFVGAATVEMEALDSESNEQVAAYVETRVGKKYHVDLDGGVAKAVEVGTKDYLRAYSTWAYTKQSMDRWAQLIRERLDAAHGKPAGDT